MVEPQIVVLVVAGSSPVGHPLFKSKLVRSEKREVCSATNRFSRVTSHFPIVPVAQPDRASDFGSEGCGFESLQARY
jgi:hypothetical protein